MKSFKRTYARPLNESEYAALSFQENSPESGLKRKALFSYSEGLNSCSVILI